MGHKQLGLMLMLLISLPAFGVGQAKVKFVRGKATVLPVGAMEAFKLRKGDWIFEGSSIVTQARSFVRFEFKDKTKINIGPNSKVVLTHVPKKSAGVIGLLKGMVKARVKKNKKTTKNKLIIKTRTAVMGVRGTKFQSTYNTANKSTSLVTVEGKVAMVKAKKSAEAVESAEALDKIIESSPDTVEVPAGRYSGSVANLDKATVPVKIAPVQYDAIAKSMDSDKRAKDVMKDSGNDPDPRGFEDKLSGKVAPKAGGYLDFSTGIYVPPPKGAKLDKKTGTFKAKSIGKVNKKTGDYIPPKGIKIDEKKGFVLDIKQGEKTASKKLEKKLAQMKESVQKQLPKEEAVVKAKPKKKSSWLPKNHIFSFEYRPFSETVEVNAKIYGASEDVNSDGANLGLFKWQQVWNEKWSTHLTVGGQEYEVNEGGNDFLYFDDSNGEDYTSLGVAYQLNKRWSLTLDLVDRGYYYAVANYYDQVFDRFGFELVAETITYLDFGGEYSYQYNDKWQYVFGANLMLLGQNEVPTPRDYFNNPCTGNDCGPLRDNADMFGLGLDATAQYQWTKSISVRSKLWFETVSAENDNVEYHRRTFGFGLSLAYML